MEQGIHSSDPVGQEIRESLAEGCYCFSELSLFLLGRKVMWSAAVCSGDWVLGFIIIPLVPLRRWRSCNFFLYFRRRALLLCALYFAWKSKGGGRVLLYRAWSFILKMCLCMKRWRLKCAWH